MLSSLIGTIRLFQVVARPSMSGGSGTIEREIFREPNGDPNGIRTRVTAVKGRCPRPLDDRVGERQISRWRRSLQAPNVRGTSSIRTVAGISSDRGTEAVPRSDVVARACFFNQRGGSGSGSAVWLNNAKRIPDELLSRGRVAQQTTRLCGQLLKILHAQRAVLRDQLTR